MNIEAFEELIDYIKQTNVKVDMELWITRTRCGTVGCIAGSTCLMRGIGFNKIDFNQSVKVTVAKKACEILGLDYKGDLWPKLFYLNFWPKDLKNRYIICKNSQKRKQIVIKHIKRFANL
jgi:hypothetical protein